MIGAPHANRPAVQTIEQAPVEPSSVRLGMLMERPVYIVEAGGGRQPRVLFADAGERLATVAAQDAEQAVAHFVAQRDSHPGADESAPTVSGAAV